MKFVSVRLDEEQRSDTEGRRLPEANCLEVVLGSGHCIRVPQGFDAETLTRLVAVLGEGRC